MITAWLAVANAGSCTDVGREPWGRLVEVASLHGEPTEERFSHVVVHRFAGVDRLGRARRRSVEVSTGMTLCEGDRLETWYDTEARLEAAGAGAMLIARPATLLWLDEEVRQVSGVVDYYVLDAAGERTTAPVPVTLGYSTTTASRQDSIFRIEIVDPAHGEALISVSDRDDVFAAAPRAHGVTLEDGRDGELRVAGGEALRVSDGRALQTPPAALQQAERELEAVRDDLDALARQTWSEPPVQAKPERRDHRLVLQGVAYPDAVYVDGERLPRTTWRRVRSRRRAARLANLRVQLEDGSHEVVVQTWGETSHTVVHTDATTRDVYAERPVRPAGSGWLARPRFIDPWVRTHWLELRPSVGIDSGDVGASRKVYSVDGEVEDEVRVESARHPMLRLPVRLLLHGGRFWIEGIGFGGYVPGETVRIERDRELVSEGPGRGASWFGGEALMGLSGGHRLTWDLGVGAVLNPRMKLDGTRVKQSGVDVLLTPMGRLLYGNDWRFGLDARYAQRICLGRDLSGVGGCFGNSLGLGVQVQRDLKDFTPFLRASIHSFFGVSNAGKREEFAFEIRSGAVRSFSLSLGTTFRVGRKPGTR